MINKGLSGLNTTGSGSITQGTPSVNLQMTNTIDDSKMDTAPHPMSSFMASGSPYLHQVCTFFSVKMVFLMC